MYYTYDVYKLIQSHESITAKQIIEELEKQGIILTYKNIQKEVERINDFSLKWLHKKLIKGVRGTGYHFVHGVFEQGELQFLMDAIYFHRDLSNDDKEKLSQKLKSLAYLHQNEKLMIPIVPHLSKESLLKNISLIVQAIGQHKTIQFYYIDYELDRIQRKLVKTYSEKGNQKNDHKKYVMSPYRIINTNDHYYVIGYYDKYENFSMFRIDRMEHVGITSHHYNDELLDSHDMDEVIMMQSNMYVDTKSLITLKLLFHSSLKRVMVSRFYNDDMTITKPRFDNYLEATIPNVSLNDGLVQWILMLGHKVIVKKPDELRLRILKELEMMQKNYNES